MHQKWTKAFDVNVDEIIKIFQHNRFFNSIFSVQFQVAYLKIEKQFGE